MEFEFQKNAISVLSSFAESDKHSILISGCRGSGKTFLAKKFSEFLDITTFHVISPKVSDLKETIESSYKLADKQVICIENLDSGLNSASQVILKYLEEPLPNVYVIITCINPSNLPSTVLSRTLQIHLPLPLKEDLNTFGKYLNASKFEIIKKLKIWNSVKSLNDLKFMLDLTIDQLKYYESILDADFWKNSIDQIMWNLGHYQDNSKSDLRVSLRIAMLVPKYIKNDTSYLKVSKIQEACLSALISLESGNISETAILGKFVIGVK